ncbi:MAG: hypothetical protein RL641_433 [Candidatus Parcubacteria bacterium]|jgi:uncharacterized delta-60 repeat protein
MNRKLIHLVIIFLLLLNTSTFARKYYNKDWVDTKGLPDSIDWGCTTYTQGGDLALTGNTVISAGNTDIITILYDHDGNALWTQYFDGGSNLKDYGVAITTDQNNNIYVAGAVTGSNGYFDIVLLKYDHSGNLQWSTTWDGNDHLHDIPTALTLDNFGNIYVTGLYFTLFNQTDFVTLKFEPNGSFSWVSTYDNVHLQEAATSITMAQNGNIVVAGGSAQAANSWDFAIVTYKTDGTQVGVERITGVGVGSDKALAITKDNSGNIFLTGYTEDGSNKNIQTVKINPTIGLEWIKIFDGDGLEDVAQTMGIDVNGNIIVSGYTKKTNGGYDFITIKYDPSGNELWQRRYSAPDESKPAKAKKLTLDQLGNIFITGKLFNNGDNNYVTIKYNPDGEIVWEETYNGVGNGDDEPLNIQLDMKGNIFVTGISQDANLTKRYTTVKYSYLELSEGVVNNSAGKPDHLTEQIIVKFDPSIVNTVFVDDKDRNFANIEDVIPDSVVTSMNEYLGFELNIDFKAKLVKIFGWMKTTDVNSISRLGETVPNEKFWSAFILTIPPDRDLVNCINQLNLMYPTVEYAQLNHLSITNNIPNDTYVSTTQESLIPTVTYPNSNINIDQAWDLETGKSSIKVGVIDHPIYWGHSEFGNGTFSGSKIAGGYDYFNGIDIQNVSHPTKSHGTSCAGIIGAFRNNSSGIAGIAGGDVNAGNNGVTLYSLGIFNNLDAASDADISSAIVQGALSNGYGVNIESSSWGGVNNSPVIQSAVKTAWSNACVFVASRGNDGNSDPNYPACYSDDWVINVSATGTDGEYKSTTNGDNWWASSFGLGVDVAAPGTTEIVSSTIDPTVPSTSCSAYGPNSEFQCFNGTSAACPHVSGVASLILSKHNTSNGYSANLAPEDVEFLIQRYATDKGVFGYDDYTGFGLLNAGETMEKISGGKYQIVHPLIGVGATSLWQSNITITLTENMNGLAAGTYIADLYKYSRTYSHPINSTTTVIDHWGRSSSAHGVSGSSIVSNNDHFQNITWYPVSGTTVEIDAENFAWFVKKNVLNQTINTWVPNNITDCRTAVSLHLYDSNGVIGIEELPEVAEIQITPNPSSDLVTIKYILKHYSGKVTAKVFDVLGQIVFESNLGNETKNTITIDASAFSQGLYVCEISTEKNEYQRKFIKQ